MNVSFGFPDQRQAGLDQPFRQHEAIKLVRWPLKQHQILADLREPDKVAPGRDAFGSPAHFVDGPRNGDGANPSLEFSNERGSAAWRDECSRLCPEIKSAGAVKEIEIEAVAVCQIRLRDRCQMAGSAAADKPVS
jgi:hypothetical protein